MKNDLSVRSLYDQSMRGRILSSHDIPVYQITMDIIGVVFLHILRLPPTLFYDDV